MEEISSNNNSNILVDLGNNLNLIILWHLQNNKGDLTTSSKITLANNHLKVSTISINRVLCIMEAKWEDSFNSNNLDFNRVNLEGVMTSNSIKI